MRLAERLTSSEQLFAKVFEEKVFNYKVKPNWIGSNDIFWYSVNTKNGKMFYKVDIEAKTKEQLFDNAKMAEVLRNAGLDCNEKNLPISAIAFISEFTWMLSIGHDQFSFDLRRYECKKVDTANPMEMVNRAYSPNGKYYAYIKDYNLFIKNIASDKDIQLTFDGEENYSYGKVADICMMTTTMNRNGMKMPPAVMWSPDGTKLITHKTDERKCTELPLLQSAVPYGQIPKVFTYRLALAGGDPVKAEYFVFDMESKKEIKTDLEAINIGGTGSPFFPYRGQAWWNGNDTLYFLYVGRGSKSLDLYRLDISTGISKKLISEASEKFIEASPSHDTIFRFTSDNKEIIGFSARDGWGHLYLYDGTTGEIKNQITKGEYVVSSITRLDEKNRQIYFIACGKEKGRNPYYMHLYKVNFDGSGLKLLTPEDAEHSIVDRDFRPHVLKLEYKHSPTGKYFVDTFSRVNIPPKTVVRDCDGNLIMKLEDADITELKKKGWTEPEPFCVKARDGKTDIYGVIYKPSYFNPKEKYPIIDEIYPGPQTLMTPREFTINDVYALAELGFIVIHVDGLGTPYRSKEFHDFCFNNLRDATIPDHVTAIKQLAEKRPYMDIEKVGITGNSAGGYAACIAMFDHGDFYKVGVASNSYLGGIYYSYDWTERYMEYPVNEEKYSDMCLLNMVDGLKGKLLLITADFDENIYAPTQIMLADALIKAKKDFDIFVVPNSGHSHAENKYIYRRKQYGYFLKHLKNEEIPFNVEYPSVLK